MCDDCRRANPEHNFVCKSTALGTYLLDPSDLTSLECRRVNNPHGRSQPPMQLYKLADVLRLSEQKYPDGVEKEQKERERKRMERLKHIEDGKDTKREKTEEREEWVRDLFREYGLPPMDETGKISPNQVWGLRCLIKKVRNDKAPSITSIFKKEALSITMECFERQEKVNKVEQLLSELSPEVVKDPYDSQKKKKTADGTDSPEECVRKLIDQSRRRKNLLGLLEEHSKKPENIQEYMRNPTAVEHILEGPNGRHPLASPVIDILLCKERRSDHFDKTLEQRGWSSEHFKEHKNNYAQTGNGKIIERLVEQVEDSVSLGKLVGIQVGPSGGAGVSPAFDLGKIIGVIWIREQIIALKEKIKDPDLARSMLPPRLGPDFDKSEYLQKRLKGGPRCGCGQLYSKMCVNLKCGSCCRNHECPKHKDRRKRLREDASDDDSDFDSDVGILGRSRRAYLGYH